MTQAANEITMTKGNLGPISVLGRALCVANGGVPILRRRLRYAEFTFLHLFPVEDLTRKLTSSIALIFAAVLSQGLTARGTCAGWTISTNTRASASANIVVLAMSDIATPCASNSRASPDR